jgi:hypothetical protein
MASGATSPSAAPATSIRPRRRTTTFLGLFRNPAFLTATFGLATLTFAMGGISAWVPDIPAPHRRLLGRQRQPGRGRITVIDGIRRNPGRRLDCPALAAHQPPRALPALLLERRSHPALRRFCSSSAPRLGHSVAFRRRVLPLPQHRPAQRRHRQLGLRAGPRHGHSPQPLLIHCFGDTFSPQIIGAISDRSNLRIGLGATLIFLVVSCVILWKGARYAPPMEDVEISVL